MTLKSTPWILLTISCGLLADTAMGHVTLTLAENKRLNATISANAMNRLAVPHDRISQIFGDEGAFVTQSDEQTGQLFIKPTPENGLNPLSLTLITENGLTQDLTLNVADKSPSTIILQGSKPQDQKWEAVSDRTLPFQENIISLMKRALLGQLIVADLVDEPRRQRGPGYDESPRGYDVRYQHSYQAGPALLHVYEIENTHDEEPLALQEKAFAQPGDLGLCVRESVLDPHRTTQLYVLTRQPMGL